MSGAAGRRGTVLHIITDLDLGGAERALVRLALGLDARGWRQSVISLRSGGSLAGTLDNAGVAARSLSFGTAGFAANVLGLRRLVREVRPALVQGWMYHGNLAASLAARFAPGRVPVLWNVRQCVQDLADEKPSTARVIRWNARLSGGPAHIVFNSALGLEQHRRLGFATMRSSVIPNGFDTARFRPSVEARAALRQRMGWTTDTLVIGLVGRFHPVKGHLDFLEAAAAIHRAQPGVRFALAGTGVDAQNDVLMAHCARLQLRAAAVFLGPIADEETLATFTAGLDIACSASHSEAFPNVIGEAMACAVPCVATVTGDVATLLGPGGLLVPPRDPAALATALLALLAMTPDERRAMGAAGRHRIESTYSLACITDAYDALYLRSLERGA
jgi:glycosyltransferase involved in cell wall biosynthesis